MTPVDWGAIVNLGSAGAVIAVVIIFLKSIRERDAEWRNFFTELNRSNAADVAGLEKRLGEALLALDLHDKQAKKIYEICLEVLALVRPKPNKRAGGV